MNFSERLKELREEREISQKKLAESLNVCISTISKYETDKILPDVKKLIKLAKIFNVSIDYFLGLSDINSPLFSTKTNPFILYLPLNTTKEQFETIQQIANVILKTDIKFIDIISFPERLRSLRNEKLISQKGLAIDLKVSISAISEYEAEKNLPDVRKLIKIAKKLNVSVDYLLCLSESPYQLHIKKISPYEITLPLSATKEQYKLIQRLANNILEVEFMSKNDENK